MMPSQRPRPWLALIAGLYLLLALGYGAINPLFEAPDEHLHYFTAQWIIDEGTLPAVPQPPTRWPFVPEVPADYLGPEAAQPPLYYLLGALILAPFDTAAAHEQTVFNPYVLLGDADAPVNRNAFVHQYDQWPWQGHTLAAHVLRAVSALIGLGTVLCIYGSGRLLWPKQPERALLAAALVAFLPQFLFQQGSISNDVLITFLVTAALYQLLRLDQKQSPSIGPWLLLGLTIGAAALTKNQGTLLLAYAIGFLVVRGFRQRPWSMTLRQVILVALPAILLVLPLWWRNWQLYGDITAANQFVALAGGDRGFGILDVLAESSGLWLSLFAMFGWFNVAAPGWVYVFYSAVVILAIIGGLAWLVKGREGALDNQDGRPRWLQLIQSRPVLLLGWVVLVYAGLFAFMLQTPAAQGRLLFPALLPLSLGVAYGLNGFFSLIRLPKLWPIVPAISLAISAYSLLFVIPPAFAMPVANQNIDELVIDYPLDITYDGLGRLHGYNLSSRSISATEPLKVTLFWEALGSSERPTSQFVQLVNSAGEQVVGTDTLHGGGNAASSLWQPGQIIVDEVYLDTAGRLRPGCHPDALRLDFGLKNAGGQPLASQIEQTTLQIGLVRQPADLMFGKTSGECQRTQDSSFVFNDQVYLQAMANHGDVLIHDSATPLIVRPGDLFDLSLTWGISDTPLTDDYIVFVHLVDENGQQVATFDRPPRSSLDNASYPTSLWNSADEILDVYSIILPPDLTAGRYQVLVGLYRPDDFWRLPVTSEGQPLPDNAVPALQLEVFDE